MKLFFKRTLKNDKGVALITVILLVSVLVALAIELNRSARADIYDAANVSDGIKLTYIAKSGFYGAAALLLNTDTVLAPGAVDKLWRFAQANPRAAIVCGQLLNADGTKQNSIASFPTLLTLAINASVLEYLFPKKYPSKRYEQKKPFAVDSAVGACILIRKKVLDEVSYFDERYFFFFEETDLALSFKRKGWQMYQVPDAFIYHLQGQSISHGVHSRIEFYRSRYQFLRKWNGSSYYFWACAIIFSRLLIDYFLNLIGLVATLGLSKKLKKKTSVYGKLISWHVINNPLTLIRGG